MTSPWLMKFVKGEDVEKTFVINIAIKRKKMRKL